MLNSYLYDNEYLEETPYNNEVYLLNDMTINRKLKRKKKCKYLFISIDFFIILSLLVLQVVNFLYIRGIIDSIEQLNINNINITKTINYINKTETIIDFVCNNYLKC